MKKESDKVPVSYSQSQSSSSAPFLRAFLSNSESTVEPESITDAKPNEITATNTDLITPNEYPEPTLDVGRVFLKGLLFHKLRKGNVNHAMAIRLFYIECENSSLFLFFKEVYDKTGKIETQNVEGRLRNEINNVKGQNDDKKICEPNQKGGVNRVVWKTRGCK